MDASAISGMIASVGFPVAVASYLILRLDATLDKLTGEILRLSILLDERLPREGK